MDILRAVFRRDRPHAIADTSAALRRAIAQRLNSPNTRTEKASRGLRYLVGRIEELVWGYGERPSRSISHGVAIIASWSLLYTATEFPDVGGDMLTAFYFSVVTFTTVGYGDVVPEATIPRLLAALEAWLGAILLSLTVAGFARRSRN